MIINRVFGKIQRVKRRLTKFSNKKEILLRELNLIDDPILIQIEDKKFYVRKERGDLSVINEIYFRGDYENYGFEEFDTIVDVGAHIGGFGIRFADEVKKIYSYEPNPQTYKLLKKNLEENEISNVQAFNLAVSDEEGSVGIYSNSNSLRSSIEIKEDSKPSENIKTTNLENLTQKIDLQGQRLLKLDCEGSEFKIIEKTSVETLKKFDSIFLEWHGDAGNPENIKNRLSDAGFAIDVDREEREIENNVGFIYARNQSSLE